MISKHTYLVLSSGFIKEHETNIRHRYNLISLNYQIVVANFQVMQQFSCYCVYTVVALTFHQLYRLLRICQLNLRLFIENTPLL